VPPKEVLLQRGEVRVRGLGDTFESQGLGGCQNVMESTDHWQRRLPMVSYCDVLAVLQSEKGLVPFKNILSAFVLLEKELWAQEPNLE
jgi:hypothetical protein